MSREATIFREVHVTNSSKVLVATRLSPAEREALTRLALENDRPLGREIRRAILRHLEREGEGPPQAEGADG